MQESVSPGPRTRGCHLPAISRATGGGQEPDTAPERGDPDAYRTVNNNFLKDPFASTSPSGRRVRSSSLAEADVSDRQPQGPCKKAVHFVPASDLGLKSSAASSSPSNHFSEESLPAIQRDQCPEEVSLLKLLTKDGQRPEWTFYPRFSSNVHTYHVGKQCFFNGIFLGNRKSLAERTVDKSLGKKKYAIDPRNGIPKLNPGDNPYRSPEQSIDFHKAGATLPPVNFSLVPYEKKFDTFIPLEPLPPIPSAPFRMKEKANRLMNEIKEVEELEHWRPATPLLQSIYFPGSSGSLDSSRYSALQAETDPQSMRWSLLWRVSSN